VYELGVLAGTDAVTAYTFPTDYRATPFAERVRDGRALWSRPLPGQLGFDVSSDGHLVIAFSQLSQFVYEGTTYGVADQESLFVLRMSPDGASQLGSIWTGGGSSFPRVAVSGSTAWVFGDFDAPASALGLTPVGGYDVFLIGVQL
jgi:hypothetical protein